MGKKEVREKRYSKKGGNKEHREGEGQAQEEEVWSIPRHTRPWSTSVLYPFQCRVKACL